MKAKFCDIKSRLSVRVFSSCVNLLPWLACDREPGCWGYPGCYWVAFGWLRKSVHIALADWPRENKETAEEL